MVDRPLFTPVAYTTTVYTEWNNVVIIIGCKNEFL
jgi:hypothetical protein